MLDDDTGDIDLYIQACFRALDRAVPTSILLSKGVIACWLQQGLVPEFQDWKSFVFGDDSQEFPPWEEPLTEAATRYFEMAEA